MTEKSATLPIVLTLLLAYWLIDTKSKVEDVANAMQDFQQQSAAHWPRGSLYDKEFLVNSALVSLGETWDASEGMAPHQVDWSLGPVQTVNAALNYVASGELAGSLTAYSIDLWAFRADMANAKAGCIGCGNYAYRQEISAKLSDSVAPSERRREMQVYAGTLMDDLRGYRPPAGLDNGHAILGLGAQKALDKIMGPKWRGEFAGLTKGWSP
jgi:hypothetical protein